MPLVFVEFAWFDEKSSRDNQSLVSMKSRDPSNWNHGEFDQDYGPMGNNLKVSKSVQDRMDRDK